MFDVHMLPARHGDCLWIEYGTPEDTHRVLIDGGPRPAYATIEKKILELPPNQRRFDLFVVSHVDDDHIGGALKLLTDCETLGVHFDDVWFNAYPHLEHRRIISGPDLLGSQQGEMLSQLIVNKKLSWNRHFGGAAVVCEDDQELPRITLPGGMNITLLSPYWSQLEKLKRVWENECRRAHITPGAFVDDFVIDDTLGENVDRLAELPFEPDAAAANGSSIAFLAEYGGNQVLFGADAFAPVLVDSLTRLGHTAKAPLALAALKVPHHGSSRNTNADLLRLAPSKSLLISSNGDKFNHPDMTAIARMVKFNAPGGTLHFNYTTKHNEFWKDESFQSEYVYSAIYPRTGIEGLRVSIE